jgi:dolichol-phosphate mannosyltransferase
MVAASSYGRSGNGMASNDFIVITGATGFVGANLCRTFVSKGARVLAVEGPSEAHWRLPAHPLLERVRVDLRSSAEIKKLLTSSEPTAFINCAAYGAYSSQTDVDRIYQVNFEALRNLLEGLTKVRTLKAFVQTGSSSEYGTNCTAPGEDAPTTPDSHYAVSKVAGTALIRFYATKFALPAWVFRLYSVYGPYEDASRLVPKLLLKAAQGELPPLVNPRISRDFVFVDDVARAVECLFERAGQLPKGDVYNIGTGDCTTLEKLVALTRQLFDVAQAPQWGSMPDRHWDHPDWYANPAKAKAALGWTAQTSLAEGLKATMRWMKEKPDELKSALEHPVVGEARK